MKKALEEKSKIQKDAEGTLHSDDNWAYIPKSIRKKCAIWFRR